MKSPFAENKNEFIAIMMMMMMVMIMMMGLMKPSVMEIFSDYVTKGLGLSI